MRYNYQADVGHQMAEQQDANSKLTLGEFWSKLEVSCVSSDIEEFWYNEIICVWMTQEKQGRAHKWCTPMDPHIWPSKSRTTSWNIHTAAMWGYGM